MKTIANKPMRTAKPGRRILSGCLCLVVLLSLFATGIHAGLMGIGTAASDGSQGVTRVADPATLDQFITALDLQTNSRRAGRIWADKSVFARDEADAAVGWNGSTLTLDRATDGLDATISMPIEGQFLHAFSTLGSSQEYSGKIPSNVVIVIDNSGSMYGNSTNWPDTRVAKTVSAVNTTIDKLMRAHSCNQVAVVLFGNGYNGTPGEERVRPDSHDTAVTIVPMAHYPYSSDEKSPYQYLSAGWKDGSSTVIPATPIKKRSRITNARCSHSTTPHVRSCCWQPMRTTKHCLHVLPASEA